MSDSETPGRASELLAQLPGEDGANLPPTRWNPPYCGEIDLRIARDGSWHYQGRPMAREALVRLFAGILRREEGRYYLVTPVEKVGIQVEDAPFIAVSLDAVGAGQQQRLAFTTGQDETVVAGPEHPLRVAVDPASGEPRPYVHVRGGLEALIRRPVFYQLVELAIVRQVAGREEMGVWSDGVFFALGEQPE